jgi:putative transposase
VKRSFKFRFYPTEAQTAELSRTFGCVRKVYNLALAAREEAWTQRAERVTYNQTSSMLTAWKQTEELAYLNEVSCVPLQQALRHLQAAYTNFYAGRTRHPRFKSKKESHKSAEYTPSASRFRDGRLSLAKMSQPLEIVWSRPLPEETAPSMVTVSQDAAGRWFISMLCEDTTVQSLPYTETAVGIDAGLDSLLTLSSGEKIANPRHEREGRTRLARAQRELARKLPGSRNRDKARLKLARAHARIADRRRDHLHKITTRLVRENQTIVIEDLVVRNLLKNRTLARAISDAAWSELREMLEYKARWYDRSLIAIDRWYPSTRLCSSCDALAGSMPLDVRTWRCACGVSHDRDVNAAKNLLAAGLAATACGAGVRPQGSTPGGQSATKQETSGVTRGLPRPKAGERCQEPATVNPALFMSVTTEDCSLPRAAR